MNDIRRFPSPTQVVRQVSEGGMELSPSAVSQDQLQMVRARVHESEAKWHNVSPHTQASITCPILTSITTLLTHFSSD